MNGKVMEVKDGKVKIATSNGKFIEVDLKKFDGINPRIYSDVKIFGEVDSDECHIETISKEKEKIGTNVLGIIGGIIFGIIGAMFLMNGSGLVVNSAIHQIYQSMQYILAVLWFILAGVVILINK